MARSIKQGMDYFPLNVDWYNDDKFYYIADKYGMEGKGIAVTLYEKIYNNGYYMEWNDKIAIKFADRNKISLDTLKNIIDLCLEEGVFDMGMYNKYGILTSKGIQGRYFEGCARRIQIYYSGKHMLADVALLRKEIKVNLVNVDIMSTECGHDDNIPQASAPKVKESKVKEKESSSTTDL